MDAYRRHHRREAAKAGLIAVFTTVPAAAFYVWATWFARL